MKKTNSPTGWEAAYQKRPSGEIKPEICVEESLPFFKENNVNRILDLGCGDGRHLVYLAGRRYQMYGLDSSPTALKLSQDWLDKEGLNAELKCGDMSELPWDDGFFDAIICIKAINHHNISLIRTTFKETHRVLRKNGLFLVTAMKNPPPKEWKDGKFTEIEHHTYVPTEGHEKDVPHYYLDENELRELMHGYEILKLTEETLNSHRYVVLGRKK
jgi:ubiquinone/menaquinone biosynthesis C-methylase UbiE